MASRRETLLNDNDVLENRQLFQRNPKLPQLEVLLRVMMEELPTYELLSVGPRRTPTDSACAAYTMFIRTDQLLVLYLLSAGIPWNKRQPRLLREKWRSTC